MHKLLKRQLRKAGCLDAGDTLKDAFPSPEALRTFLEAVDSAYAQSDRDRELLERSLDLASREMLTQNRQLRQELEQRGRLEIELRQAEKLIAVGQLASGIAHEINTPIQFVGDSVNFLKESFADLQRLIAVYREHLASGTPSGEIEAAEEEADLDYILENVPNAIERTLSGVARVSKIVRAMKVFAYRDQEEKALADLNEALRTTLIVAGNETKYVADVQTELEELPPVLCHVGDLNQVFLNLIINAAHAIGEKISKEHPRGLIRVASQREDDQVVISVSDTGTGIPPEVQRRIFEPFFTTKPVGKGSGQGLSIVRSIVTAHGGSVDFQTIRGEGTTFFVRIPIGSAEARSSA